MAKRTAYEATRDRILELLEQGVVPWQSGLRAGNGMAPRGLESKSPYRGTNAMITGCQGYASPYWVTFNKARGLGGKVRKGERGTPIVHAKVIEKKDKVTGDVTGSFLSLRYWTVFNLDQTEGITPPEVEGSQEPTREPSQACLDLIAGYQGPTVEYNGGQAYYKPSDDSVHVPKVENYTSPEHWFKTVAHELAHSTGHRSRLAREGVVNEIRFGNHDYACEELVAEFAASFLAADAGVGVETVENSAAYIQSWSRKIAKDPKLIMSAASAGQKAADWVTGKARVRS